MISNCDKFKALVPTFYETDFSIVGKYKDSNFYLFYYDKVDKDICIHIIKILKQYDNEGKLYVHTNWSTKTYKTEKPALKALSTSLRTLKEFHNLLRVEQINADF